MEKKQPVTIKEEFASNDTELGKYLEQVLVPFSFPCQWLGEEDSPSPSVLRCVGVVRRRGRTGAKHPYRACGWLHRGGGGGFLLVFSVPQRFNKI